MCVIITLQPGQMIDKTKLDNAISNNPHGWGLILRDQNMKRLEVIRRYNENADYLEEIYDVLESNTDIQRFLHLRFNTKGSNGLDNVHPFQVYHSDSRQVWLMHNGTMSDWSPKAQDTRSDTRIFCEDFVSPFLLGFEGDMGKADYNHPVAKLVLDKLRGSTNSKLLVISNDLEPQEVGYWSEIKNTDGSVFRASNADYFYTKKRGVGATVTPFHKTTTHHGTTDVVKGEERKVLPFPRENKNDNDSKSGRKIASLKELSSAEIDDENQGLPASLVEGLSKVYGADNFLEFGPELIDWLQDVELKMIVSKMSSEDLVHTFKSLVAGIADANFAWDSAERENRALKTRCDLLATDLDVAEQRMDEMMNEMRNLKEKNKRSGQKVAELMQRPMIEYKPLEREVRVG